ncbi:hypothetical protein B0H17DRAFT_1126799 [Mycena rosella]|uniref:Uncharacterized protein n=1 Tax=Mycena rosella TaxID=1033263 RepID=A0AAD7GSV4_MYCRO|nr:hypothetical protein B0H17DRAFT_1126799 [Mycena rosella]
MDQMYHEVVFEGIARKLTGIAPLANGSAHLNIGQNPHDGGGGTEILAAAKLKVEKVDLGQGEGVDGGRIVCTVSCNKPPNEMSSASETLACLAVFRKECPFDQMLHARFYLPLFDPASISWPVLLHLCVMEAIRGGVTPNQAPTYLGTQVELNPPFSLSLSLRSKDVSQKKFRTHVTTGITPGNKTGGRSSLRHLPLGPILRVELKALRDGRTVKQG